MNRPFKSYLLTCVSAITMTGLSAMSGHAADVTVTGAETVTTADALTDNVYFVADGEIPSDGALIMTKDDGGSSVVTVSVENAGMGTIAVTNTSGTNTFGTIGASTVKLRALDISGAGGTTSVTGDIFALGVLFTEDGTLNLLSTDGGSNIDSIGVLTNGTGIINVANTSGTNIFGTIGAENHALAALNINGTGGGTIISNSIVTELVHFGASGFIMLGDAGGSDIAAITTAADNTGGVQVGNTSGVNTFGTIGASGNRINALMITGDGGTSAVTGDIYATTTAISDGATLTTSGNITGEMFIWSGGRWNVNATGQVLTGAFSNNGTIDLGANTISVEGNITGTDPIIRTTIGAAATSTGTIINTVNTANATFIDTLSVIPTIASGASVETGDKFVIIHGNTGQSTVNVAPIAQVTRSGGFWWTPSTGSTGLDKFSGAINAADLIITATRFDARDISGVNKIQAAAVNALDWYTGSDADVLALQDASTALTTAEQINKAGAQLSPDVNAARHTASFNAVDTALDTLLTRNFTLRSAQISRKGVSSGEAFNGFGIWGQGFGSFVNTDRRKGVNGYESATGGLAIGADTRIRKNIRVGALFAYANTHVDQKGDLSGSNTSINSYIGTAYGTYTAKRWYIDGNMTFGFHDYENERVVNFSGTPQTAKGDFGGRQFGMGAEVGYPVKVFKALVTPYTALSYNFLSQDSYTETGAPGANLSVDSVDASSLKSSLGSKISATAVSSSDWTLSPNAHMTWQHEFFNDAPDTTSRFSGGTPFVTPGVELPRESGVFGVGLDVKTTTGTAISAKYDLEIKSRYIGNNFMVQMRQRF